MKRASEALKVRTKDFALRVLRLYRSLRRTEEARILGTCRLSRRCTHRNWIDRTEFRRRAVQKTAR